MNNATHRFVAYLIVLLFALVSGMTGLRHRGRPLRLIAILLACTVAVEITAFVVSRRYHNNLTVYHYFAPVYLALTALYYDGLIPFFHKYHIGWWMAAAGIALALVLGSPERHSHSAMLMFEALVMVSMSLIAIYHYIALDLDTGPSGNIHFWLSLIFLVFWCGTFMIWALMKAMIILGLHDKLSVIYTVLWLINMITYAGIGVVFLLFRPKHDDLV